MERDDLPVGRILSRREALMLLSGTGGAFFLGGAAIAGASAAAHVPTRTDGAPALNCIVRPETTEGPYFTDERLERSDIRLEPSTGETTPGSPLTLAFNVSQIRNGACAPLPGALVDVWHCDAQGRYSAFADNRIGFDTRGESFLRGYQRTDERGAASFTTIYPGWYPGRAVHIHFRILVEGAENRAYEFTSQLFFDESLNDAAHALQPYADHGRRNRLNANDGIFRQELLLDVASQDDAYDAAFHIGLDLPDGVVSAESGDALPSELTLARNYPNPFNPETTIRYALPQTGHVRLAVYDMTGKPITTLVDGVRPAGRHSVRFNAGGLPTGAYICRLTANGETKSRKITFLR